MCHLDSPAGIVPGIDRGINSRTCHRGPFNGWCLMIWCDSTFCLALGRLCPRDKKLLIVAFVEFLKARALALPVAPSSVPANESECSSSNNKFRIGIIAAIQLPSFSNRPCERKGLGLSDSACGWSCVSQWTRVLVGWIILFYRSFDDRCKASLLQAQRRQHVCGHCERQLDLPSAIMRASRKRSGKETTWCDGVM